MKKKYIWNCDYCGEEFATKRLSDKHELTCPKNRANNELVLRFKKPRISHITIVILIIVIGYVFVFGLVDSYAKSNNLPRKDFLHPLSWLSGNSSSSNPTPTLAPLSTTIVPPTSTPKQTRTSSTQNNASSNSTECIGPDGKHFNTSMFECEKLNKAWNKPVNYMTSCIIPPNCGGGTRKMSKIECDAGTCCQVGSSWSYYSSTQSCRDAQSKLSSRSSEGSNKLYEVPFFQEKYSCRSGGLEDFVTYQKLWTENMKIANELGIMNTEANYYLELADGYMKKWKETLARFCTKI